ncbi:unnamed protein product [Malus baccata var. baccata]|uniref:Transmembrane protein n=1 Tax=Malus domestica TaxID=3750 RepID=A0A498HQ35_MALDO|nr:hypothetical protein DVH24_018636 [Malus domestica]
MALASFPNHCIPTQTDTIHVIYTHPTATTISHHPSTCCPFNKMDTGSVLLFLAVAAIIFFCPLIMGPLNPPALPLMVAFAMVLGAVWIALNHASK